VSLTAEQKHLNSHRRTPNDLRDSPWTKYKLRQVLLPGFFTDRHACRPLYFPLGWSLLSSGLQRTTVDACTCSSGLGDINSNVGIAVDLSALVPFNESELRHQETTLLQYRYPLRDTY